MKSRTGSICWTLTAALNVTAMGQNCDGSSTGRVPLNDLGTGLYLGQFQGGLYPGGSNQVPAAHAAEGLARAHSVLPLDTLGQPSPTGRYVLLSIGMSNATQEFCSQSAAEPCDWWSFMGRALSRVDVNREHLSIVNGALAGQVATLWDDPNDQNYNRVRDQVLAPRGLSEAQVRVVWLKNASREPEASLPGANADANLMLGVLGSTMRALRQRYPNLQMVFLSSRIYAGYATTTLNPEPFAYEGGFAVKWLIEAQIAQMGGAPPDPLAGDLSYDTVAPWVAWGPYLWADGMTPRSDGLVWRCQDFNTDGTHPAPGAGRARDKVGSLLEQFFFTSPFCTPWMLSGVPCHADFDGDGRLLVGDIFAFLAAWFAGQTGAYDFGGTPGVPAIFAFLSAWFAGC